MKKEIYFGLTIMAGVVLAAFFMLPAPADMTNGHLGLLMLALIVVAIMLGFPTAFTLMGMGMFFAWIAYRSRNPDLAVQQTLDLMVQRAFSVMSNDVLISIPLFVFMGYLVERANLIEKLFKSLHLAMARVPGSLAVATIVTCAIFATATGIVGAVVTLMGLLALPAMLKAKYDVKIAAGAITAGGCLGILIPPSVMLIVYGATAGVSVVKLYAGAFFPGIMLATLYVAYIILVAKWKPHLAPPLSAEDRVVPLPAFAKEISKSGSTNALAGLVGAIKGKRNAAVPMGELGKHLAITVLPILATAALLGSIYMSMTTPIEAVDEGAVEMGLLMDNQDSEAPLLGGLQEPESADGLQPPPMEGAAAPVAAPAAVGTSRRTRCCRSAGSSASGSGTPPCAPRLLDCGWRGCCGARLFLRLLQLCALGNFQDAAGFLFPAGHADTCGAGDHCFRSGYANGSCGYGVLGWTAIGSSLPALECFYGAGVGVPHRQNQCHGVLAVCGLQYFLGGVCLAGRTGNHQPVGLVHGLDPVAVHAFGASGDFLAGLAAGMDRDHCDFHADLYPPAATLWNRPPVLRFDGGIEPPNGVPEPTGGDGSFLPEGCQPTTRDPESNFRGHDAVHGNPGHSHHHAVRVPRYRNVAAWGLVQLSL